MLHANVRTSGVARGSRLGEVLSIVLFGISMVMVIATVYILVGRGPKLAAVVEVDLLSLAPADTREIVLISLDDIEKESAWMSMLRENLAATERVRAVLAALELSIEDFSQIAIFGRDKDEIVAIRLKPGRSIDPASLLAIPDAKPEKLGDRVWARLKDGNLYSFDRTTLLATRKESTMRDILGRKLSSRPSYSLTELFHKVEPAPVRIASDAKSTDRLLSPLAWVLRGNMPDLTDGTLRGMSMSIHLSGERAEIKFAIHHRDKLAAVTSAKDFDRIAKSWKPDIAEVIKVVKWASREYGPMWDDVLSNATTSVDDNRMTIRSECGLWNARPAVVGMIAHLEDYGSGR